MELSQQLENEFDTESPELGEAIGHTISSRLADYSDQPAVLPSRLSVAHCTKEWSFQEDLGRCGPERGRRIDDAALYPTGRFRTSGAAHGGSDGHRHPHRQF